MYIHSNFTINASNTGFSVLKSVRRTARAIVLVSCFLLLTGFFADRLSPTRALDETLPATPDSNGSSLSFTISNTDPCTSFDTTSGNLRMDIRLGESASGCISVAVSTDAAEGYTATIAGPATGKLSASEYHHIKPSGGTMYVPKALAPESTGGVWGFAIPNGQINGFHFDFDEAYSNPASSTARFADVPNAPTAFSTTNAPNATPNEYNIFFGVSASTAIAAGFYSGEVMISATINQAPTPPDCTVIAMGQIGNTQDGAIWDLCDDGTVLVGGGTVSNSVDTSPWNAFNDDITRIVFTDAITAGVNIRGLFTRLTNLTHIEGLENFDTTNTRQMSTMFMGASSLVSISGLSGWNTSNATHFSSTFNGASSLTSVDLSSWDTGSLTNISSMFNGASSIVSVGDLSGWDVSGVETMSNMFLNAGMLVSTGDLSGWDTSNVTAMNSVFNGAGSLETIGDISGWNTSSATTMTSMFQNASSLTNIGTLANWDTSNVTTTSSMFNGVQNLVGLELGNWDTASVTIMSNMFLNARSLTALNLSNWDTSNVTAMGNMFMNTVAMQSLTLGPNFIINANNPNLPGVPNNTEFTGVWTNLGTSAPASSLNFSSPNLINYLRANPSYETWVWQVR